jgi:hypothetical protein
MAEIEFSIFARQAWAGYIPDEQTLQRQVRVLEDQRNVPHKPPSTGVLPLKMLA